MIYCVKCGTQLPDDARFCAKCGTTVVAPGAGAPAAAAAAPAGSPTIAAAGVQELKCPTCGAPIKPTFGDTVVTCDYCGGSVTLGGAGWKGINKHTMLPLTVRDQNAVLQTVKAALDTGLFHRHAFEESTIADSKLSYVPFWVLPVSASTTYTYQDAAASIGSTVGTMAAAELLGGALGGRRSGFTMIPVMAGPVVNPTRSETMSGQYEYPVVAVKSMTAYQPKDYQFQLTDRTLFDKKSLPSGTPVLNGDLGEDAARGTAKAQVEQLQSEAAHKKHSMVSKLDTKVDISEGELLHVPVWFVRYEHKGNKIAFVIDGNSGAPINSIGL